ncbi:MAG: hypothetical protein QME74_04265 [Candidatus Edwardsbacteria bacterium]|nr:hypothetical protein [Candidatus Edwardsbacteria bacterium]
MASHFPIIILVARPAAGKSEVIDFLKKTPLEERLRRFHVRDLAEFDDFLYIWEWFAEDDILEKHGRERLHTKPDYYFKDEFAWNLCIEKINLAVVKRLAEESRFLDTHTAVIEFARGGENGFREAFSHLSDEILEKAAIVYIKVSYEESIRKNKRRARKGLEDSILYHSLPDDKMEFYYKVNDWDKLAKDSDLGHIEIKGHKVPYAALNNEPEVTDAPEKLGPALEKTFGKLWELAKK